MVHATVEFISSRMTWKTKARAGCFMYWKVISWELRPNAVPSFLFLVCAETASETFILF